EDQQAVLQELEKTYVDQPGVTVDHLDGLTVAHDDWWFNVRASNTEPLLRLCLESLVSVADMEAKRDEVLGLIRS
ncbi:MAG: phosphomannomutase/phosphoglucomutase, partial [Solirubrobacteraceae bacterium]